jgi:uncharacterized protein (TIGR00661 family)
MKILYAIQGTGNGHISRARDIVPVLQEMGEVDVLISGVQAEVSLGFPVRYHFKGLSLIFGKKGGVDVLATYRESNLRRLLGEINSLPVEQYQLVISDFEPVSAWACYNQGKTCIGLSHQAAVLNKKSPKPKKFDPVGRIVLKNYAPVSEKYGFHFQPYARGIFTPVIRQQVRSLEISNQGHFTVYLPAYDDGHVIKVLSHFKKIRWEVFSKSCKTLYSKDNFNFQPIDNEPFLNSLASSAGVICGAGFETPAEVLFLGKKLMVIPMRGQYEQQCNAAALKKMDVPVLKSLKKKHRQKIDEWLKNGTAPAVTYADETAQILKMIVEKHAEAESTDSLTPAENIPDLKEFKHLTLRKVLAQIAKSNISDSTAKNLK